MTDGQHRTRAKAGGRAPRVRTGAVLLAALLAACSRGQPGSPDAGSGRVGPERRDDDASPASPRRLVDAGTAQKCTLTYHCGLSHPGLGRTSNEVAIDLVACTKTVTRSSLPYEDDPPPPPDRPPVPPVKKALASATCADLAKRVSEITDRDEREAQESARMDTTACSLTVSCPEQLISVQRQSLTGPSPVVKLIQAMHSAR